jgi:hypothetical protein
MYIATTENVSSCTPMKTLTAFLELELAIRACGLQTGTATGSQ